jgi:hypothetical protein
VDQVNLRKCFILWTGIIENNQQELNQKGEESFIKGRINKALTYIEKTFTIDSNNRITIMDYASLLKMLNKLDDLRQVYIYYLKNNSHNKEIIPAFQELNGYGKIIFLTSPQHMM